MMQHPLGILTYLQSRDHGRPPVLVCIAVLLLKYIPVMPAAVQCVSVSTSAHACSSVIMRPALQQRRQALPQGRGMHVSACLAI